MTRLRSYLLAIWTTSSRRARISKVLGLQRKHLDLQKGIIQIQQRSCRRVLTLGALVDRYVAWIAKKNITKPDQWLFPRDYYPELPLWDSGIRKALKEAAAAAVCDFKGFGLHAFRRANITWRQEVGTSAIEASKIAGHGSVNMTNDYIHVQLKRQDELTRAIQNRLGRRRR